jgi:hypothetical protein
VVHYPSLVNLLQEGAPSKESAWCSMHRINEDNIVALIPCMNSLELKYSIWCYVAHHMLPILGRGKFIDNIEI